MQLEINSSIQSLESTLGMFPCQLLLGYQHFLSNCMAGGYICALNADRSCRAQLLMEHSYPFSHYCLLYVRFTRPEENHQGHTHMCVCVCVHRVANKEEQLAPGKHLSNTLNRNLSIQTKDFFPHHTPDVTWYGCKHKSQGRKKIAQTSWKCQNSCIISLEIVKHKSGAPAVRALATSLFLHEQWAACCCFL